MLVIWHCDVVMLCWVRLGVMALLSVEWVFWALCVAQVGVVAETVGLCCDVTLLFGVGAKVQGWSMIGKKGMVLSGRWALRLADCSARAGHLAQSELV